MKRQIRRLVVSFVALVLAARGAVALDPILGWQPSGDGIDRGPVTALASAPDDPRLLFAGAAGEIYRSTDSGAHWELVSRLPGAESVAGPAAEPLDLPLEVDPEEVDQLLRLGIIAIEVPELEDDEIPLDELLQGEEFVEESELETRREEYRLRYQEERYQELLLEALRDVESAIERAGYRVLGEEAALPEEAALAMSRRAVVEDLAVGPAGRLVLAATTGGLQASRDGGVSWQAALLAPGTAADRVRSVALGAAPGLVLAGADSGLYRSTDEGRTFAAVPGLVSGDPVTALAVSPGGWVYAGTERSLFQSTDGGQSFRDLGSLNGGSAAGARDLAVISDEPGGLLAATALGLHRRQAEGIWRQLAAASAPPGAIRRVAFIPADPERFLAVTDSRVYQYDPAAGLLREVNFGLQSVRIGDVHAVSGPSGDAYLAAGQRVYRALRQVAAAPGAARELPQLAPGALRVAAYSAAALDPGWETAWIAAARRRAWLPEMTLGLVYDRDQSRRQRVGYYDVGQQAPSLPSLDGFPDIHDSHYGISLGLTWRLGGLIFHPDGLRAAEGQRRLARARYRLAQEVVRLDTERRRLEPLLAAPGTAAAAGALDSWLQYAEVAARLDGLTGHYLTQTGVWCEPAADSTTQGARR